MEKVINQGWLDAYADSPYVQVYRARLKQRGYHQQVDATTIPRLPTLMAESAVAHKAQLKEHGSQVAAGPYAFRGQGMHQPPGSPFATPKELLVNPPEE